MTMPAGFAPAPIQTKAHPGALATIEPDGSFEGYAALFGRVDLGRDLILPGAFARSLTERGTGGVRMLFQHDPAEPIGTWLSLREDAVGLHVRGRLTLDVARAREVLALMRAGAIDGLSIGFRTVEGRTDPRSRVRRLSRIDLWEVSVVTFPMQPDARIAGVKRAASLAGIIRRGARRLRALPGLRPLAV
ncbi:MAG: phage prohead protease, family [Xanthobacteraceae bacterium]|jgi:HK97 family phage prohead protease|nr:phage prohead protease, family [Xanthobacteraceae bacterium]